MRNHGNLILSVSELGRFLAEQAEAVGAVVLPETAATKPSSSTGGFWRAHR